MAKRQRRHRDAAIAQCHESAATSAGGYHVMAAAYQASIFLPAATPAHLLCRRISIHPLCRHISIQPVHDALHHAAAAGNGSISYMLKCRKKSGSTGCQQPMHWPPQDTCA